MCLQLIYVLNSDNIHKIYHEFKNILETYYYIKCKHKLNYISITETLNCERKVPIMHYGRIRIDSKSIC